MYNIFSCPNSVNLEISVGIKIVSFHTMRQRILCKYVADSLINAKIFHIAVFIIHLSLDINNKHFWVHSWINP